MPTEMSVDIIRKKKIILQVRKKNSFLWLINLVMKLKVTAKNKKAG